MKNDGKRKNSKRGRKPQGQSNGKSDIRNRDMSRDVSYTNTESDNGCVGSKPNDVAWYVGDNTLLQSGANFSYAYPLGTASKMANVNAPHAGIINISGLCSLRIAPFLGVSKDGSSALNQAVRKMYAYIRHANSGAKNYDPADLGMYLATMDAIYTMFWHGVRAYGVARLYNAQNRYIPDALSTTIGFDSTSLKKDLAQLRYGLNVRAAQINNLVIPDTLSLFKRHRWLFSGLYADGTSPKAQVYCYVPSGYYQFNLDAVTKAGKLTWNEFLGDEVHTVDEYFSILDAMMAPIITNYSEDFGLISGDIMKAYDTNTLYTLPFIEEGYAVTPTYSEEVLSQIQNATVFTGIYEDSLDITQDVDVDSPTAGAMICRPRVFSQVSVSVPSDSYGLNVNEVTGVDRLFAGAQNRLVSLNLNEPKPEDTMVATRLTAITGPARCETFAKAAEANRRLMLITAEVVSCGTELCVGANYYRINPATGDLSYVVGDIDYILSSRSYQNDANATVRVDISRVSAETVMSLQARLSHFRYHPMSIVTTVDIDTTHLTPGDTTKGKIAITNAANWYIMEIDNYVVLQENELKQLNDMAVLAELGISGGWKV